jgi:hypothetical protein
MAILNTAKYTEAIEYLSKFKSEDVVLGALAKEQSEMLMHKISKEEALDNYLKAVAANNNDFTTPRFY